MKYEPMGKESPFDSLRPIFHEPHRLAIMSALCAVGKGVAFSDLKRECGMTDGNLSRHLKALEEARAVRISKSFIASRPRTTLYATDEGRAAFLTYLQALEEVLHKAVESTQGCREGGMEPEVSILPVQGA